MRALLSGDAAGGEEGTWDHEVLEEPPSSAAGAQRSSALEKSERAASTPRPTDGTAAEYCVDGDVGARGPGV